MTRRLTGIGAIFALVLSMFVSVSALQPAAADPGSGFHIHNGRLYDANGHRFVLRGVAHPHTWFRNATSAFADIASLGANAVRVVLSSGDQWERNRASDVANVISLCKANDLICILEVHDTTGYPDDSNAVPLGEAVNYWIRIQDVLEGEEEYILINIGNEPVGNDEQAVSNWASTSLDAVDRMRSAGFDHTLLLNAPNWGQDWSNTMRDNAAWIYDNTPNGNVMFSVHMYGVYSSASTVQDYLTSFTSRGLPIIVGEFGHRHSDGEVAEDAIMSTAESLGIGYMGWSWSGNGSQVDYLDMVNDFDVNSLTGWGQRIFYGANGIQETAEVASVFGGGGSDDTQPPSPPGTPQPSDLGSASVTLTWAAATDNVGVTSYEVHFAGGSSAGTTSATSVEVTGLSPNTQYTFTVRARDAAGNVSEPSGPVTVTTTDGPPDPPDPGGQCAVDYRVQNQWSSGFTGAITITNNGDPIDSWTLEFDFTAGQQVTNGWKGNWSQSGSHVTVTSKSWNAAIGSGESVSIGFNGSHTGSNPEPTAFALNGVSCSTT